MTKNTNRFHCRGERGSALLIVLGFLSFMIISAVAFAIYMRIERQASSNYRHAASARHLLNSALYRAMDEIDSELRAVNMPLAENSNVAGKNNRKFPTWPGRVRTSAVVNSQDNGGNARVLSLDALSYIPGILLNDVRYYAVPPLPATQNITYTGAKWRSLSMPLITMDGMNAAGSAVVGRYSYVCINVSDMLNMNHCKAAVRDAAENRVSIGHLFKDDAARKAFDDRVRDVDIDYETLQDFYACMFNYVPNASAGDFPSSPWHEYLNNHDDYAYFRGASHHILMADGEIKAEPTDNPNPHNILTEPPISDANLSNLQPIPDITFQGTFSAALVKALAGNVPSGAGPSLNTVLPTLLCDYIDEDNVPSALNMPSVEIVPMISQISMPPLSQYFINTRNGVNAGGDPIIIYVLDLTRLAATFMNVEVMWPYKNTSRRSLSENYVIEAKAYVKLHKVHAPQTSKGFIERPTQNNGYIAQLTGSIGAPTFSSDITDQDQACRDVSIPMTASFAVQNGPGTPSGNPYLDLCDSEGGVYNGFTLGGQFSISFVLGYVRVKNSGNGKYVDCVPTLIKFPGHNGITDVVEFEALDNKLFFQTNPSVSLSETMAVTPPPLGDLTYEWRCLETPDPRFNWMVNNWIRSNVEDADGQLNKSTKDILALNDGRDGDIFMAASNAGKLQSPGELGYIIRPFPYEPSIPDAVDFRTRVNAADCYDYKAMFRTIRLYDHGDPANTFEKRHDDIYNNFIAANADKSVIGARVNPLSDIALVLGAAVERAPLDYWIANEITKTVQGGGTPSPTLLDANFSELMKGNDWRNFTNGWGLCLNNAREMTDINTDYASQLKDEYCSQKYFGWYSQSDPNKVFDTSGAMNAFTASGVPAALSKPLHEVDRKMLYSFSLDSFSDRQQLFLYIISAQATAASFGDQVTSLAGGKAIALVWRDPYPAGYDKGAVVNPSNMFPDNDRISPWHQNYVGRDDDDYEYYDNDRHNLMRESAHHDQKILFFKYLDK